MSWVYGGDWNGRGGYELPYILADLYNALAERYEAIGVTMDMVFTKNGQKRTGFVASDFIPVEIHNNAIYLNISALLSKLMGGVNTANGTNRFFAGWAKNTTDVENNHWSTATAVLADLGETPISYPNTLLDGNFLNKTRMILSALVYPIHMVTALAGRDGVGSYPDYAARSVLPQAPHPPSPSVGDAETWHSEIEYPFSGAEAYDLLCDVNAFPENTAPGNFVLYDYAGMPFVRLSSGIKPFWHDPGHVPPLTGSKMICDMERHHLCEFFIRARGRDGDIAGTIAREIGACVINTYNANHPSVVAFGTAFSSNPTDAVETSPGSGSFTYEEQKSCAMGTTINAPSGKKVMGWAYDGWPFFGEHTASIFIHGTTWITDTIRGLGQTSAFLKFYIIENTDGGFHPDVIHTSYSKYDCCRVIMDIRSNVARK